ncbi:MAG: hypothetical protein K2K60_03085 [Clostridia bacterium]|nr:hypothetical protein [Clostridia bacterium]
MTKIKIAFITLIAAMLLIFTGIGATVTYAETEIMPPAEITETVEESNIDEIAASFTEYLKARYGEEYETYYNAIIEKWGSIEGYLLAFGDKLPEEHRNGWQKFVGWLSEYSSVWAPALAVVILIIIAVIGKKIFNKTLDRIVKLKVAPIVSELNLQSNATVAMIHAQKALLGNNERFTESVEELTVAEKELENE